ncbi:MAG TPA: zinc-binding dehydrogenase, partial [Terriglobia bacterium]|nr:zinc-binding dehydrogenase [Terriglobia bacterium]
TGIGGGVSLFALQISIALGATAYVTSGSDLKLEKALRIGAAGGVNYRGPDWTAKILEMTHGSGPDVVIDSIGGSTFDQIIDVVKPGGRIVTYGSTTGATPQLQIRRIFWKQLDILGSTMGTAEEFRQVLRLFEDTRTHPVLDRIFPLEEASAAHQRMERGEQFGKIVLRIDS